MARNPVVFQNGTLIQKATVEIDGNVYEVEPAQYEGTTPLSANNLNRLQDNLYNYVDENINEIDESISDVKIFKETVNPISSYSSQMPFKICWRRVGNVVTITMQITVTRAPSGGINAGTISSSRYLMNIPNWAIPSNNYDNIADINNSNRLYLCGYYFPRVAGFSNNSNSMVSGIFSIDFYYDKTNDTIYYNGNYVNPWNDVDRTYTVSMSYIIN